MDNNFGGINGPKPPDTRDGIADQILGGLADTLGKPVVPEHQLIRDDFHLFGNRIMEQKDMPFHTKMRDMIMGGKRGVFLLPRGFGKSNVMSVQLPAFILGKDRDARIIIATNALRLGVEWLREIENIMTTNSMYRDVFGNLVPEARTGTWTDTEKIVAGRSPSATHTSLYVVSSTGSTLGKRASHILVDDVFEPEMGLPSESQIRRVKEWFWKVLFPVLDPDGCIYVSGTRFHPLDLYGELIDRGWPSLTQAALITDPSTGKEVSAWPERFSVEELQSRRNSMGSIIFNLQYQNNADISSRLQLEFLHLIPEDEIPKDLVIYQGVDPCLAVGANPDYFAMATIGVSEKTGKGYLLDLVRARVDFVQQIEIIMQQAAQWNPRKIGVETNAAQIYMKETLQDAENSPSPTVRRLSKRGFHLPIVPLPSKSSKENRIMSMSAMFESGLVSIKAQKDSGGLIPVSSLEPFVSEWLMFPSGRNDDSLDAVEKCCRVAEFGLPPPVTMYKETKFADLPFYRRRPRLTLFNR